MAKDQQLVIANLQDPDPKKRKRRDSATPRSCPVCMISRSFDIKPMLHARPTDSFARSLTFTRPRYSIAMTRAILILILSTLCAFAGDAAWPGIKFSEVRAYAWPDDKTTNAVILKGMTLKDGVINPKGASLTPEQTKILIGAVTGKRPKYPVAMCHNPHNAFVFYNAAKKPVAFVEICFRCFNHRISPKGAAENLDLVALAAIFDTSKLPMGKYGDLSTFKKHFDEVQKIMNGDGHAK
jgi:hypothetical protein